MKHFLPLILCLIIASCTSFNDAMTPSAEVKTDAFDDTTIIYQAPVSAASNLSEAWHTLGFEWSSKTPNKVYLIVGVHGIENISAVAFNIDSEVIDDIQTTSSTTTYDDWSTRRFVINKDTFIKLATANSVKMKVTQIGTYSVSSFGVNSSAIVSAKFEPFLTLIDQHE